MVSSVVETLGSDFSIREATQNDLFYFLSLTREFHKEASYGFWDQDKVTETFMGCLSQDSCVVYMGVYKREPVSFIFGTIAEGWASRDKVAVELGWFTSKEYRGVVNSKALLLEFESWARGQGAMICSVSSLSGLKSLDAVYKRFGYSTSEVTFTKEL